MEPETTQPIDSRTPTSAVETSVKASPSTPPMTAMTAGTSIIPDVTVSSDARSPDELTTVREHISTSDMLTSRSVSTEEQRQESTPHKMASSTQVRPALTTSLPTAEEQLPTESSSTSLSLASTDGDQSTMEQPSTSKSQIVSTESTVATPSETSPASVTQQPSTTTRVSEQTSVKPEISSPRLQPLTVTQSTVTIGKEFTSEITDEQKTKSVTPSQTVNIVTADQTSEVRSVEYKGSSTNILHTDKISKRDVDDEETSFAPTTTGQPVIPPTEKGRCHRHAILLLHVELSVLMHLFYQEFIYTNKTCISGYYITNETHILYFVDGGMEVIISQVIWFNQVHTNSIRSRYSLHIYSSV